MQAEAVGDLVDAVTPLQARVAFDQLEGTLTRSIAALDAQLFDLVTKLEASIDFPDTPLAALLVQTRTANESNVTNVSARKRCVRGMRKERFISHDLSGGVFTATRNPFTVTGLTECNSSVALGLDHGVRLVSWSRATCIESVSFRRFLASAACDPRADLDRE